MAEPFTIYKITILYMLDKAGFPLTNTQISNFFLDRDYTDYFRVQEVIGDLEDAGLIVGFTALVKPAAMGYQLCAFINLNLSENNKYPEVTAALKKIPEIVECHFITGRSTLLVKLYCSDNAHLMEIVLKKIQNLPYVQSTETIISLDEAFERQVWVKSGVK